MAVPFAVFALAPLAFTTPRHRAGFITAMVWFGAYLGLTAFFEIVGPHQLVFPHFILNTGWGTKGAGAVHRALDERPLGPFCPPARAEDELGKHELVRPDDLEERRQAQIERRTRPSR